MKERAYLDISIKHIVHTRHPLVHFSIFLIQVTICYLKLKKTHHQISNMKLSSTKARSWERINMLLHSGITWAMARCTFFLTVMLYFYIFSLLLVTSKVCGGKVQLREWDNRDWRSVRITLSYHVELYMYVSNVVRIFWLATFNHLYGPVGTSNSCLSESWLSFWIIISSRCVRGCVTKEKVHQIF